MINYDRMRREAPRLKAALTRAKKSGDPLKVLKACEDAVKTWNEIGAWPDNWATWNVALADASYEHAQRTGRWDIPQTLDDIR